MSIVVNRLSMLMTLTLLFPTQSQAQPSLVTAADTEEVAAEETAKTASSEVLVGSVWLVPITLSP